MKRNRETETERLLFGWMQNKLNGKQGNKKPNTVPTTTHPAKQEPREEFSDWPHGLLAIGTFGNNDLKENAAESQDIQEDPTSSEEILDNFTPEEVGKLHKELTKLLTRKPSIEKEIADLPLDRFLNCPSSLEVDRRNSNALCSDSADDHKDEDIEKTISVILGRCKEICGDNNKKAIGKKSISFLLKKMFVCRSGFAPQPSFRDTFQESRMEKLLRVMLNKKIINPQGSSRAASMKKYLGDRQIPTKKESNTEDDTKEKINDGCKWVKTDSECKCCFLFFK
ncbi:unnamed protein product [Prunus armeniaca]|uniref:NGR2 n=1 Tax=Prunus armeniaca TaxID=36596 RepID=A0A6J5WQY6_PRUAR|nr:unnamed protein product [Prunus armeniaca]